MRQKYPMIQFAPKNINQFVVLMDKPIIMIVTPKKQVLLIGWKVSISKEIAKIKTFISISKVDSYK